MRVSCTTLEPELSLCNIKERADDMYFQDRVLPTTEILALNREQLREIRGIVSREGATCRLPNKSKGVARYFLSRPTKTLLETIQGSRADDKEKKMESRTSFLVRLLLLALLPLSFALKFDIQAHPGAESASKERCIRNFVAKDQLVVVTATISGHRGDGQVLNLHVSAFNWTTTRRVERRC